MEEMNANNSVWVGTISHQVGENGHATFRKKAAVFSYHKWEKLHPGPEEMASDWKS